MSSILIIDNDKHVCETIESLVTRNQHNCSAAYNLSDGLEQLKETPFDLVFLDISLPDGNGLSILPQVKRSCGNPEVIILTGKGDVDAAERAIQNGAWDFLVKPTSIEQITLSMEQALNFHLYKQEQESTQQLDLSKIVGSSNKMKGCYDLVADAARSDANVLLNGETGTGKELFASTIHANSIRSRKKFVVVDCASLTESLLESTLFGHIKGAFTGAQSNQVGLVAQANQGTLFLDEIGELPLSAQKTLLRVLQERSYRPVGDTKEYSSNFRLIAATNRNLEEMVEEGTFRQDLLYRIHTIHLYLPSLRSRREDIKDLAIFKLQQLSQQYNIEKKSVHADFFEVLQNYEWPGNVRQLFNVVERAFIASADSNSIYILHLPAELRISMAKSNLKKNSVPPEVITSHKQHISTPNLALATLKEFKEQSEKQYLETLLAAYPGDTGSCLKTSGLSRSHFYALLKKHSLRI